MVYSCLPLGMIHPIGYASKLVCSRLSSGLTSCRYGGLAPYKVRPLVSCRCKDWPPALSPHVRRRKYLTVLCFSEVPSLPSPPLSLFLSCVRLVTPFFTPSSLVEARSYNTCVAGLFLIHPVSLS